MIAQTSYESRGCKDQQEKTCPWFLSACRYSRWRLLTSGKTIKVTLLLNNATGRALGEMGLRWLMPKQRMPPKSYWDVFLILCHTRAHEKQWVVLS